MSSNLALQTLQNSTKLAPVEECPGLFRESPPIPNPPTNFVQACGEVLLCWTSARGKALDLPTTMRFFSEVHAGLLGKTSTEQPIAVVPLERGPVAAWTHVAIVHPSAARVSFNKATESLTPLIYRIFPCVPCEVNTKGDADDVHCRNHRIVPIGDLQRSPSPAVSMRFKHVKKKKSSTQSFLGVASWKELLDAVLPLRDVDGFCEFENFEGVRGQLKHQDATWELVVGEQSVGLADDKVEPWLHAFFFEGQQSAAKTLAA